MKKNLISLAVAASVLGGAAVQAGQYVNPDNTGQVLLFPFYNADNGNSTNMHIANTTGKAKAVKIRFVEHKNSDEVLDFNLYLSPYDHFAFAVLADPNGTGAAILTRDNSCTVPALGSANPGFDGTATENANGSTTRIQPFVNFQYADDADATIERTLTGHVEVIEMGVLENVGDAAATQWADFATHGATGVPANCAGLVAGFPAAFAADDGVTAQEGGLYGMAYHIDVAAAASFGFEATAVDDWADGDGNHTDPGSTRPSLLDGTQVATIHTGTGANQYTQITAPNSSQAISAILMTESLSNEVLVNSAIGGMTDWVVTFPTKRLHVDQATAIAPYTNTWTGEGTEVPACEVVAITQYDREEQTFVPVVNTDLQFSPLPPAADPAKPASICNEVAVIAMGAAGTASALNVTTGLTTLASTYSEGWQRLAFANTMEIGGATMTGLPVVGFGAYKSNNGAMSYGNTAVHKRSSNNVVSS
ncbi:MAG: hypothetical protein P8M13_10710 [Luminiphilus sp.]|nr:hypothetical protein [Luminiphilus sp.]